MLISENSDFKDLYRRWLESDLRAPELTALTELLQGIYFARRLPRDVMGSTHFVNDDELRSGLVIWYMTVTEPSVLMRCAKYMFGTLDAYHEHLEAERTEAAEYEHEWGTPAGDRANWPPLEVAHCPEEFPYPLMLTQLAVGQRVSIALEVEDDLVTGFKVEGVLGGLISDHLTGLIGFPEPSPELGDGVATMKRGDLDDYLFVRHLQMAARFNLI